MKNLLCAILACFALSLWASETGRGVISLPLGEAANTSRLDDVAGDGKGGWLDMGSNDLHVLPAGPLTFCGVPFEIPPDQGGTNCTCIVLGRPGGVTNATLRLSSKVGPTLYLLHATADSSQKKDEKIGIVRIRYADGSVDKSVRMMRDVFNWNHGRSRPNAVRAWTQYNDNMQVALFASKFPIDSKRTPVSVEFVSTGICPWMILAVAEGADCALEEEPLQLDLRRSFKTPPTRRDLFPTVAEGLRPKNVILIIGDGMGEGILNFTSLYCHGHRGALEMQQFPVKGRCTTTNVFGKTTDSAAAATAFATGAKTANGILGLTVDRELLTSFAQRAHEKGLSVGLLTNDSLAGATPSGFYAHVSGRGEAGKIAEQAFASGYEILIGNRETERAFQNVDMADADYVFVKTPDELFSVPKDEKVFGAVDFGDQEEILGACVTNILGRLSANEDGFFLMAECALPDKGGHANKPELSALGVVQTDWMAVAALDFALSRDDTLVIVTADHETGRVRHKRGADGRIKIIYGATNHTEEPVALFAYGPGAERFKDWIDNTDIAKTITDLLGL